MKNLISFLNANIGGISHFEEMAQGFLIHMKNGDTLEFYSESKVLTFHYEADKDEE